MHYVNILGRNDLITALKLTHYLLDDFNDWAVPT